MAERESLPRQLDSVLASAADFLHKRGVGDGAAAVDDARRLIRERDRAIETRENANAVSVRVEAENRRLRDAIAEHRDGLRADHELWALVDGHASPSPRGR